LLAWTWGVLHAAASDPHIPRELLLQAAIYSYAPNWEFWHSTSSWVTACECDHLLQQPAIDSDACEDQLNQLLQLEYYSLIHKALSGSSQAVASVHVSWRYW
jgi:hypothetical protein